MGGLKSYYSTPSPSTSLELDGEGVDVMTERIDTEVDQVIGSFFTKQSNGGGGEDLSGNQAKKLIKLAQAATREAKRKAQAPATVSGRPGGGIQSARRRNYRR